jgi:signal transduction histidine kinase
MELAFRTASFFTRENHIFAEQEIELLDTPGQPVRQRYSQRAALSTNQAPSRRTPRRQQGIRRISGIVSHEFRTPLNVVLGYAEVLKQAMLGEVVADQQEATEIVIDRFECEAGNDQLDFTRDPDRSRRRYR